MTALPGVRVRPAGLADLDLIVAWGRAFFEHLRAATADPWFEGATFDRAAFADLFGDILRRGEDLVSVAGLDGGDAGYLYARLERPFIRESPVERIGHVSHIWVEPRARGQGVAKALLADAEAWFQAQGVGWMELSYHPANASAVAAWTTLGFEPHRVYARRRI